MVKLAPSAGPSDHPSESPSSVPSTTPSAGPSVSPTESQSNTHPDYPDCHVTDPNIIDNGICEYYGGENTEQCGWDGGDCLRPDYPDCHDVSDPNFIGERW